MTSVACLLLGQLSSIFIHVDYQLYYSAVIYLVIQSLISAVVIIIIYAHCSSARAVPFYTHTHHGRVLTTLDLHVQILDGLQVFDETVASRIAGASSYSILVLLSF